MRFPGYKKIVGTSRWIVNHFIHGGLILGYHLVTETTNNIFSMCVTPDHFAEHLRVLNQYANPVDLYTLVNGLQNGRFPRHAVALTFDDGYAEVLYCARPSLESSQIPATVFVVPGYLGREFWWDELARLLLFGALPAQRPWPGVGEEISRIILTVTNRLSDSQNSSQFRWSVFNEIYELLRHLPCSGRELLLAQLRSIIVDVDHTIQIQRALTPEELIQLSSNDLITIGAHTMSHAELPYLPKDQQKSEIYESKVFLEELLGKPVHGFAFPHSSYTQSVEGVVRQVGFQYACAGLNNVVWRRSSLFRLPRFWVPDWDGDEFERWLRRWLN